METTHTAFPKGMKFGYTAAIMRVRKYRKKFTSMDPAWKFTKPTNPETYDPSIKTLTAELTKAKKEAVWEPRQYEHRVYIGIEYVWKGKTLEAYGR